MALKEIAKENNIALSTIFYLFPGGRKAILQWKPTGTTVPARVRKTQLQDRCLMMMSHNNLAYGWCPDARARSTISEKQDALPLSQQGAHIWILWGQQVRR